MMARASQSAQNEQDIILRDRYRSVITEYLQEIAEIIDELKLGKADRVGRFSKIIHDLDKLRGQLLILEGRLSNEQAADPQNTTKEIDFDATRRAVGRRLDQLRRAHRPRDIPK